MDVWTADNCLLHVAEVVFEGVGSNVAGLSSTAVYNQRPADGRSHETVAGSWDPPIDGDLGSF